MGKKVIVTYRKSSGKIIRNMEMTPEALDYLKRHGTAQVLKETTTNDYTHIVNNGVMSIGGNATRIDHH